MSEWERVKKEFLTKGLIEELFVSPRGGYAICLYAGWRLIALCTDPSKISEVGQPYWIFITEQDANVLIKHSADRSDRGLFEGAVSKVECVYTYTQTLLEQAIQIQGEIARGEREVIVTPGMLLELKKGYVAANRNLVEKFGIPPRFSKVKFAECMISCLFITVGGPFWLLGRPLPAILCILNTILMLSTIDSFFFIFFLIMGFLLFYVPIRLCGMKMKDRKGVYVVSAAQKECVSYALGLVEKYQNEIACYEKEK